MRPALTAADRCSRCGAQAHAVTQHQAGELLWCGHHYRQHQDALTPSLIFMTPEFSGQLKTKDTAKT